MSVNPVYLALLGLAGFAFAAKGDSPVSPLDGTPQTNPDGTTGIGPTVEDFYRFDDLFVNASLIYRLNDPWMIKGIALTESFNESSLTLLPSVQRGLITPSDISGSKSSDGKSWGIMQFTLPTAQDYDQSANETYLNDPAFSIDLAGQYLSHLQTVFPLVNPRWDEFVVKSYNQGEGNSQKELNGQIAGYANDYWARYQRNRQTIRDKQRV